MIQLRCASPFQTGTSRTPFGIGDQIGAFGRIEARFAKVAGLAAAGAADDQNVLVPGILGIFRPACHGDSLCLGHWNILKEIRVHIGGYVRGCAP